jgi:hypothetical protein
MCIKNEELPIAVTGRFNSCYMFHELKRDETQRQRLPRSLMARRPVRVANTHALHCGMVIAFNCKTNF